MCREALNGEDGTKSIISKKCYYQNKAKTNNLKNEKDLLCDAERARKRLK